MLTTLKRFITQNLFSFLLFVSIGTITAIIYFTLFTVLWKKLALNYNIAISISYLTSTTFYFFSNRTFTFKSTYDSVSDQLPKFIILISLNYLITLAIVHGTVETLKLSPYLGIIFAAGTTTAINYLISKFWVFQIKHQE